MTNFLKKNAGYLTGLAILAFVLFVGDASAATGVDVWGGQKSAVQNNIGLGNQDIRVTIAKLIRVALSFLGMVAVIVFLMGGLRWMTSGGDSSKVEAAKGYMRSGVIGMMIILGSWGLAEFVLNTLMQAIGAGNTVR